jgi:hypothetical protein
MRQVKLTKSKELENALFRMFGILARKRKNLPATGKRVILTFQEGKMAETLQEYGKQVHQELSSLKPGIDFDFDEEPLFKRYINWIASGDSIADLSVEDTLLLEKCSAAAYYFLLEEPEDTYNDIDRMFIAFHKQLFETRDSLVNK